MATNTLIVLIIISGLISLLGVLMASLALFLVVSSITRGKRHNHSTQAAIEDALAVNARARAEAEIALKTLKGLAAYSNAILGEALDNPNGYKPEKSSRMDEFVKKENE
jgi:hypothetical protein